MQRQQRPHRRCLAQDQQRQAGEAGEEQHDDEGGVHAKALLVHQHRIALPSFRQEPDRSHQQPDAAERAEHHWRIPPGIRRFAREEVVVQRRHACGREAQQEAVEREMVKQLSPVGRAVVLVEAADAAAVEITQLTGIADRLPN